MIDRKTPYSVLLVLMSTVLLPTDSWGDTGSAFSQSGGQPHRDYFSELPGEHIDTLTGSLILTTTDLVVPGNASSELRFQRTYNSKDDKWTFAIVGIPKVSESGTSPNETTIFVDDSGAAHSTVVVKKDPAGTPTERWVASAQFWKFDRQERVLYLPDGSRVYYDTSYRPIQRRDPFGNLVDIVYDGLTTRIYQQLTPKSQSGPGIDGETREIDLTYQTLGGVPTSGNPLPLQMRYQGKTWTYSSGGVIGPEGVSWGFSTDGTFLGNSGLTVTTPHGGTVRYEFETNSYVVPIGDPNQQQTVVEFSRFLKRRIVGGRDATGSDQSRTWTFTYTLDSQHLPPLSSHAEIQAPSGTVTAFDYKYEYDPSAFIQGAPIGPPFADSPSLPLLTERAVFDGSQAIEHESLLYTRVQIITSDETSSVTYFSPEVAQRVIERDGKSFQTQYVFRSTNHGDFHRPYQVIETSGDGARTTEREFDYQFDYPFDLMTSVPVDAGSFVPPMDDEKVTINGETAERSWTYDKATGFLSSEVTYGIETTHKPGVLGNVASSQKGNVITEFSYDWGVVSQIRTAAYTTSRIINPDGTLASETKGTRTTQFTYDDLGRVIRMVPPAGNEVITTYDNSGGTYIAVRRGSSRTITYLDGFGRAVQSDTSIESNKFIRTVTTYDAEGRKTFESYPFYSDSPQVGTSFTYDAINRVKVRTNPGGTQATTDYGPGTVTVHDEENRTTTQTWSAFGSPDDARLVAVTDANQQTWNYEYNVLAKLTRVTGGGVERTWHYRPGAALLMDEAHPESGLVQYTDYDAAGNLTHKIDANQTDFTYSYDPNGRLIQILAGGRTTTISYEPNSDNRETASVDDVVSRFKYDDAGRLYVRTDVVPGGGATSQIFEYDGNDNLLQVTYATGRIVRYTYDIANRIVGVEDVTPDNSTTNNKQYATNVQYHPSGALVAYTTGNQVQHTFAYDPNRYWPTEIHASAGNFNLTYTNYDAVGNVRTLLGSGTGFNQTFQYDALDRLTRADGPYGSVYYAYDANGNRQAAGGSTYTYDGQRLINQGGFNFNQTFTYDDNGNLKTGPNQGDRYDYTPDNQLSSSTVNGVDASYQYDADGWRISKTSQGYTYVYTRGANGQLMSEITPSIRRDYVYIGSRMIAMIRNVKDGAAPEPKLDPPAPGPIPGNGLTFGFSVVSPVGVALSSAQLVRAPKTSSCNAGDPAGCSFATVDTQSAPTNITYWSDRTSLTDTPASGTYVYTVRVADVNGAVGTASPVLVDTTGDMTPDAFSFTDQSAASPSTSVTSNIIQITGITGNVVTGISGGGSYRICSNSTCSTNPAFITNPSAITNGLYLQLRATSSASNGGVINTVMSVGTVSDTWTVTTSGGSGPSAFSFADQTNVTLTTLINSNIIQLTGITGTVATSIAGAGAYRICADSACSGNPNFITSASTVTNGSYLQLRATSSSQYSTAVSTTMTVGSVSDPWSITTLSSGTCTQGTGGTITNSGQYTVHAFTASGTFNPCVAGNVEVLIVAGGGGGGGTAAWGGGAAGGGAGGIVYVSSMAVTPQNYSVVVGAGGTGGAAGLNRGQSGSNSSFNSNVAVGGGGGGTNYGGGANRDGLSGGSGGGAGYYSQTPGAATSGQGNAGGTSSPFEQQLYSGGGGGGKDAAGGNATPYYGGNGGNGHAYTISGTSVTYGGGGGGGGYFSGGTGGSGGGGTGGSSSNGTNATPNTGGGGGGADDKGAGGDAQGGNGGSGIVLIRYLTTADNTPDAFAFTAVSGVSPSTDVMSDIVRINGISASVSVSISGTGASYRVCVDATCSTNPTFITTASTIPNGGYLQLRTTSSANFLTAVTATVTVSTVPGSWTVTTAAQDTTPDPFSYPNRTNEQVSTWVSSGPVKITGINTTVSTSVSGAGAYHICSDATCSTNPPYTTSPGTISNNQYLELSQTSSASANTTVSTTVTVGTFSTTWSTTTGAQDTTPDAFSFTDQTGVAVSTQVQSNILPITGISGTVATSISGSAAAYRICTNATCSTNPAFTTAASTMTNGQYLQLRMTSSSSTATAVSTTMTVGTASDNWSVTTTGQDDTPNPFSFSDQSGVPLSTTIFSNVVQVTGIAGNVSTSINGSTSYRICNDATCSSNPAWTTSASTITNGKYLQLKLVSAGSYGTLLNGRMFVGTYSTVWSVTTVADPCSGSPAPGTTCADGSKFAGYSPANGGKMYTTPGDYPGNQQFAWGPRLWGQTSGIDGAFNTNGLAQVSICPPPGDDSASCYYAAVACYNLTAHGKSDWYLPSPAEWNAMDPNRFAIGGFAPDNQQYWTSAEENSNGGGVYHVLGSSFNGYTGQGIDYPIRCVRKD